MAEYINRKDLDFLNDFRIDSGKYVGLRLDDVFNELATEDVIERSEYDNLHEEHLKAIHRHTECLKELHEYRSKIDKAIEKIDNQHKWLMQTKHTLYDIDIAFESIKSFLKNI